MTETITILGMAGHLRTDAYNRGIVPPYARHKPVPPQGSHDGGHA